VDLGFLVPEGVDGHGAPVLESDVAQILAWRP